MADIKQAALWLEAGFKVRQASNDDRGGFFQMSHVGSIDYFPRGLPTSDQSYWIFVSDLLADDWELVEDE